MAYEYLNLLPKELDDRQRAVCCTTKNSVVAAGAGSGKTQVLATRFAWLVMSCNIPASKILTLTFTKKAAGEMYERIYDTLSLLAENENTPEPEKSRAKKALENFGETHIQTLDSYCDSIVRQAAARYGIRPDFSTGSSDSEKELKDSALPFVLKYRNTTAVKTFSKPGELQNFADEVFASTLFNYVSIAEPDNFFTQKFNEQVKEIVNAFNYLVLKEGTKPLYLTKDISTLPEIKQQIENILYTTTKKTDYIENTKKIKEELENYILSCESITENEIFIKYASVLLKIKNLEVILEKVQTLPSVGATTELKKIFKQLNPKNKHENENSFIYFITSITDFIKNFNAQKELYTLLDLFHTQVKRAKKTSGKLSFRDVQKMALVILKNEYDLREQEYNAYDKIMIDEFQDNNGENKELLFLLSSLKNTDKPLTVKDIDKEKLFFVGDEKQSIYKFRGADVAVFNELQKGFKEEYGSESVLPMEYNYRSNAALITSFNLLFGTDSGIFKRNTGNDFEAEYLTDTKKYNKEIKKPFTQEALTSENVKVHFCMLDKHLIEKYKKLPDKNKEEYLDINEQIAYYIAQKIKEIKEATPKEQFKYSDIAILDKSRSKRKFITRWLSNFGIPYSMDQNSTLFESGIIFDIYTFLRLCAYPQDKNAMASYLASPFVGLNENEVEKILSYNSEDLTNLEKELGSSWEKYNNAKEFYETNKNKVLSQSITQSLDLLWNNTGYRYETLLTEDAFLNSEQFDMLYELARTCDSENKNLAWFVDQLAIQKNSEEKMDASDDDLDLNVKDVTYPVEKSDAVQILTIHKSKGLQYKHVIIYGCTSPKERPDTSNVFFTERTGVSVQIPETENYFKIATKDLYSKKWLAEFRRILYVAITRAEEDVYIFGNIEYTKKEFENGMIDEKKLLEQQLSKYYNEWETDENFALNAKQYKNDAPFDYIALEPKDYSVYNTINAENTQNSRKQILNALYKTYKDTQTPIQEIKTVLDKTTPSSTEDSSTAEIYISPTPDVYDKKLQNIIKNINEGSEDSYKTNDENFLENENFTSANFGTLAHAYMEAFACNVSPEEFRPEYKMFKNLTETQILDVKNICIQMVNIFSKSSMGKALKDALAEHSFVKAEYEFKTMMENFLVRGSIDLIFKNKDGTYTLLDYKSDKEIKPATYFKQQKWYRTAASRLLGCKEKDIKCFLYYLRYNETIEIMIS